MILHGLTVPHIYEKMEPMYRKLTRNEPTFAFHGKHEVSSFSRFSKIDEQDEVIQKDCTKLGFSKTPLPLTALASYPGSGNTWLRHLIQQGTGKYN